jgi:hypothetical protein
MKNVCPSCGSGLLSDKDSSVMSVIQGKLTSQRFASSFTETQIYDISLFIFNELNSGLGGLVSGAKTLSKNKRRAIAATTGEDSEDDFSSSEDLDEDEGEDFDLSSIRKEVESEFSESLSSYEEDSSRDDEDVSSKAERLKKLYEQRALANGGSLDRITPKIKRGGFKGITRST